MGETLGIAHNVFEKMERERDRKERMKKYEDWQKEKVKKQQKIKEMQAKVKDAEAVKKKSFVDPNGAPGQAISATYLRTDSTEDMMDRMDSLGNSHEDLAAGIGTPSLEGSPPRIPTSEIAAKRSVSGAGSDANIPNVSLANSLDTEEAAPRLTGPVNPTPPTRPNTSRKAAEPEEAREKTPKCGKCVIM